MSAKTLFSTGAVLGLLCFAMPALQVLAAEPAATEPFLSSTPPPAVLTGKLLTLQEALDDALQASPELTAYAAETRAREAEVSQAARFINPEFAVEVENVAGSGDYGGFDAAETTLQLSQQLELGNKRQLRRGMAEVEHDRAVRDMEIARIDLQARIARNFLGLLNAQEHLKLANEQMILATKTLTVVEEKIAAGRAPSVEKFRFQSALAEARLAKEKAVLALTTSRQTLANALGRDAATFGGVSGNLTILPPLPTHTEIEAQIGQSPEIARRKIESEAKRRELALARANRIVDPTIGVGLRNFKDSGDNALIFGLSLPLPLFDRNQGNVQAATHRLSAAQAQEASGVVQSRTSLSEGWQSLATSSAEAQMLRDQIVPSAQQTFEAASYGYQSGKFGVLEVQDAQRTLFEVRERYLDVLTTAHLAALELDRQLGRAPLSTIFTKE
jgi:cobalt-zinc-cadmium efflux system outer membrane protein